MRTSQAHSFISRDGFKNAEATSQTSAPITSDSFVKIPEIDASTIGEKLIYWVSSL